MEVHGVAQETHKSLLAYEEYQIGNYTVGRGYDPGSASGDRVEGVQTEIGWDLKVGPDAAGLTLEPFGFYDAARIVNYDAGGYDSRISSYGGGFRVFSSAWKLRFDLFYGKPQDPPLPGAKTPDGRALVELTKVFSFH